MEIHQYWTVPMQIDTEDDHPILRKEVEAAVQSLKGSQLELTTTQQNWSKQVERM